MSGMSGGLLFNRVKYHRTILALSVQCWLWSSFTASGTTMNRGQYWLWNTANYGLLCRQQFCVIQELFSDLGLALFFGWQTRKLSATNQQWSLWLHTKQLMDISPRFWIMRPSTFGKYSIFHPLQGFSANNFTSTNAILFIFSRPERS